MAEISTVAYISFHSSKLVARAKQYLKSGAPVVVIKVENSSPDLPPLLHNPHLHHHHPAPPPSACFPLVVSAVFHIQMAKQCSINFHEWIFS
jgi:hypothetical protein